MTLYHKYKGKPFEDYLIEISKKIGVDIIDNTVKIPPSIGSGFIKDFFIEDNFCLRYYSLIIENDVEFELFNRQQNDEVIYKLVLNLDGDNNHNSDEEDFHSSNVLLYSTDNVRKGFIKRNTNLKRVAIIFGASWLESNYAEAFLKMESIINNLVVKNKSTILSEGMDSKSFFLATQLATEMEKSSFTPIHIKTAALVLLNDFLNKIIKRDKKDICSNQTIHFQTILKVEEKINQSINHAVNEKLPNLESLASEFNLSLSTLKRHFRIVYGKNIYQYYQEKRMEWGKIQLEQGQSNVGEIATHLGFYKINNFSKAFKKYFGVLPRELKHKAAS